ncbi:MAG: hypothetical protein IKH64_07640 [Prevotella sp.]|nr:hypothetical protein [Prevotella sp.]
MRKAVVFLFFITSLSVIAQSRQELRDSLKAATERLAYYPDSIDLRLQKAAYNLQLEQWNFAKEEYDYILNRYPNHLAALFYRAYTNERLYRYAFARLDYENLLLLVPAHFESRLGLALLNQKDKKYTEAMDQINLLVSQHPDSALAYAARAGMETEREMFSLAIYDYTEAIKRDPKNTEYILSRADLYIRERRFSDAKKDLDRLVALGIPKPSLKDFYKQLKR